jgi:AcrR family transcriptional regulator
MKEKSISAHPDSQKRGGVRGEAVVKKVLSATIEQLAAVGYSALRVDEVAERAGVNKTSIYRRWPTKSELVIASLRAFIGADSVRPNTGSLRGDMIELLEHFLRANESASAHGLMRVMMTEQPSAELEHIGNSMESDFSAKAQAIVDAAIRRGELAPNIDPLLLFHTLMGSVHHALFKERKRVEPERVERIVDLLLYGALLPSARTSNPHVGK